MKEKGNELEPVMAFGAWMFAIVLWLYLIFGAALFPPDPGGWKPHRETKEEAGRSARNTQAIMYYQALKNSAWRQPNH